MFGFLRWLVVVGLQSLRKHVLYLCCEQFGELLDVLGARINVFEMTDIDYNLRII